MMGIVRREVFLEEKGESRSFLSHVKFCKIVFCFKDEYREVYNWTKPMDIDHY